MWQKRVAGCSLFLSFNSSVDLPAPYTLQEVEVGIINTTICDFMYQQPSYRYNIWGDMICAGDAQGGRDACFVSVPPHPNQSLLTNSAPGLRGTCINLRS